MSRSDTLPQESWLHSYARPRDFLDCYSVGLADPWAIHTASMTEIAELLVSVEVPGAEQLVQLRNLIVKPLGLKTSDDIEAEPPVRQGRQPEVGDRIGFFKIYSIHPNEIILGEDDVHQDFRVSLYREAETPAKLYVATCCQRHNLFGHVYLAAILPFHKMIVKGMLDGLTKKLASSGSSAAAVG